VFLQVLALHVLISLLDRLTSPSQGKSSDGVDTFQPLDGLYILHSYDRRDDDDTWDDQNDAGDTKTILGFIGTGLNDLTLHCS
jgi:hypothetical protein